MRCVAAVLSGLTALCSVGCSTFDADWEAAGKKVRSIPETLTGRWEGTWTSEGIGSAGPIRALVTQSADGKYVVRSVSEWGWWIIWFDYESEITMALRREGGVWKCKGTEDLGFISWVTGHGTVYHYDAQSDGRTYFNLTYKTEADHGDFKMARPKPTPPAGGSR